MSMTVHLPMDDSTPMGGGQKITGIDCSMVEGNKRILEGAMPFLEHGPVLFLL